MTFEELENLPPKNCTAYLTYSNGATPLKRKLHLTELHGEIISLPKGEVSRHTRSATNKTKSPEYFSEGYYIEGNVDNHFFELTFATYDPATGILSDLQDSGDFGGTILECKLIHK